MTRRRTAFATAMRKARKRAKLTLLDMNGSTGYAVHILSDIERGIKTPDEGEASAIRLCLCEMSETEDDLEKLARWGNKPTPAKEFAPPSR